MKNHVDAYLSVLTSLTGDNVAALADVCAPDVQFRDPFNDVRGVEHYITIMAEAFENLEDVSFEVLDVGYLDNGCLVKWNFHFRLGKGDPEHITGVSEVRMDADGKVTEHLDYWDAGERIYAQVPVLGGIVRFMRARLSAGLDKKAA